LQLGCVQPQVLDRLLSPAGALCRLGDLPDHLLHRLVHLALVQPHGFPGRKSQLPQVLRRQPHQSRLLGQLVEFRHLLGNRGRQLVYHPLRHGNGGRESGSRHSGRDQSRMDVGQRRGKAAHYGDVGQFLLANHGHLAAIRLGVDGPLAVEIAEVIQLRTHPLGRCAGFRHDLARVPQLALGRDNPGSQPGGIRADLVVQVADGRHLILRIVAAAPPPGAPDRSSVASRQSSARAPWTA
jgi:hypothetical protein